MNRFSWILALLFCSLASAAFAQSIPPTTGSAPPLYWQHSTQGKQAPTPGEACTIVESGTGYTGNGGSWATINGAYRFYCFYSGNGYSNYQFGHVYAAPVCAAGGTFDTNTMLCTGVPTCPSGYTLTNGQCVPNASVCTAGKVQILNMTAGWARSGVQNAEDHVGPVVFPPASVCYQGCTWDQTGPPSAAWRSAEPSATGLYRLSWDQPYLRSASSCTAPTTGMDPLASSPPCPGTTGEFNGKPYCAGTAAKPVTPPSGPSLEKQAADSRTVASGNANPAAGAKPATGDGAGDGAAGRTPATGDGGPGGGPASAAGAAAQAAKPSTGTVTRSDGTTGTVTFDLQSCGVPGKPACKIDETGTPSKFDTTDATAALNKAASDRDGILAGILKPDDKQTGGWSMPSILKPEASCQPFVLGTLPEFVDSFQLAVNMCPAKPFMSGAVSFVWLLGTFLAVLGMVRSTVTGGS